MLDWMNAAAVHSSNGASWLVPVAANGILFGLALDYDIFLYTRIHEYMTELDMPLRPAIINSVVKTGDIITNAGVVMSLSFLMLCFSGTTTVNQYGVLMVMGILIDTFLIRTVLVPSVLSISFDDADMVWDEDWRLVWEKFKADLGWSNNYSALALAKQNGYLASSDNDHLLDSSAAI